MFVEYISASKVHVEYVFKFCACRVCWQVICMSSMFSLICMSSMCANICMSSMCLFFNACRVCLLSSHVEYVWYLYACRVCMSLYACRVCSFLGAYRLCVKFFAYWVCSLLFACRVCLLVCVCRVYVLCLWWYSMVWLFDLSSFQLSYKWFKRFKIVSNVFILRGRRDIKGHLVWALLFITKSKRNSAEIFQKSFKRFWSHFIIVV